MLKYVMVGVGGCLGSMLRFWVGSYIGSRMGTRFPYGTLVINITGSFLIGLVFALLTARTHWSPNWRYLIPIGFIGGYTTFSSFEYETLRTIQDGQIGLGFLYVFVVEMFAQPDCTAFAAGHVVSGHRLGNGMAHDTLCRSFTANRAPAHGPFLLADSLPAQPRS